MAAMNRGRLIAMLALSLAGCSFSGSDGNVDAGPGDSDGPGGGGGGKIDGPLPVVITPKCKFTLVDLCAFTPGPALTYSNSTIIDTSSAGSCDRLVPQGTDQPELCVKYAESITINSGVTVRGIGTRPLVFAANKGHIQVTGALTVSSQRQSGGSNEILGAGGADMACEGFPDSPDSAQSGGGGGAGGGFSGKGGNGGKGATTENNGGISPDAIPFSAAGFLRGGCRGQLGGDTGSGANGAPGNGGPAGGAIYLAAAGEIIVQTTGSVAANGGGGRGGSPRIGGGGGGGGGGGSGGMVILEATNIRRLGAVIANGGAGGEGGMMVAVLPFPGDHGEDGRLTGAAASGGNDLVDGHGGDGSETTMRNGRNGQNGSQGGGGGGGAAGFIRFIGASDGAGVLSPPLSN